jgi:hypothetical protein
VRDSDYKMHCKKQKPTVPIIQFFTNKQEENTLTGVELAHTNTPILVTLMKQLEIWTQGLDLPFQLNCGLRQL